jgi:hypothetical protein
MYLKLNGRSKSPITDLQLIIHILNYLNDDYEIKLNPLEHRLQTNRASKPLTIEDIRSELSLRFERITNNQDKSDKAFYTNARTFKGRCTLCGKKSLQIVA